MRFAENGILFLNGWLAVFGIIILSFPSFALSPSLVTDAHEQAMRDLELIWEQEDMSQLESWIDNSDSFRSSRFKYFLSTKKENSKFKGDVILTVLRSTSQFWNDSDALDQNGYPMGGRYAPAERMGLISNCMSLINDVAPSVDVNLSDFKDVNSRRRLAARFEATLVGGGKESQRRSAPENMLRKSNSDQGILDEDMKHGWRLFSSAGSAIGYLSIFLGLVVLVATCFVKRSWKRFH